jgi:hypothetical protein
MKLNGLTESGTKERESSPTKGSHHFSSNESKLKGRKIPGPNKKKVVREVENSVEHF